MKLLIDFHGRRIGPDVFGKLDLTGDEYRVRREIVAPDDCSHAQLVEVATKVLGEPWGDRPAFTDIRDVIVVVEP